MIRMNDGTDITIVCTDHSRKRENIRYAELDTLLFHISSSDEMLDILEEGKNVPFIVTIYPKGFTPYSFVGRLNYNKGYKDLTLYIITIWDDDDILMSEDQKLHHYHQVKDV